MNTFLSFNLVEYVSSVQTVVLAMAVGVFVAAIMAVYYRSLLGKFIRYLLKEKIFSPEQALSVEETPYKKNVFIRSALASGNAYGSVLYYSDGETVASIRPNGKRPNKEQIKARKYYIPDELKYRAEFMFKRKGTNLVTVILLAVAMIAVVLGCLLVIPKLLDMTKELIASFQ